LQASELVSAVAVFKLRDQAAGGSA